jgi:hypothetical protein
MVRSKQAVSPLMLDKGSTNTLPPHCPVLPLAAAPPPVGESAIPIYIIFDRRLKKLGRQLFDRTLQIKLGVAGLAPSGGMAEGPELCWKPLCNFAPPPLSPLPGVSPLEGGDPPHQQLFDRTCRSN